MSAAAAQVRTALENHEDGLPLPEIVAKCAARKSSIKSALQAMLKSGELAADKSAGPHKTRYTLTGKAASGRSAPPPAPPPASQEAGWQTGSARTALAGGAQARRERAAVPAGDHRGQPAGPDRAARPGAGPRHRGHQGHRRARARELRG